MFSYNISININRFVCLLLSAIKQLEKTKTVTNIVVNRNMVKKFVNNIYEIRSRKVIIKNAFKLKFKKSVLHNLQSIEKCDRTHFAPKCLAP